MNLTIEIKENPIVANSEAVLELMVSQFFNAYAVGKKWQFFFNFIANSLRRLFLQLQHLFDRLCFPDDCVHAPYYKYLISVVNNYIRIDKRTLRVYPSAQVLNTPQQADSPAPESRGFFTSIDCLWPGSGQRYNTGESRESCKPSCCGVQVPGRSSEQGANFEHISKEANHGCSI